MPSLINRIPVGLLSLLGIKSVGQNPVMMPDSVQPVLDLTRFYTIQISEYIAGTSGTANTVGAWPLSNWQNTTQTELWIVQTASIWRSTGLPAATQYTLRLGVYDVLTGAVVNSSFSATYTVGQIPAVSWCDAESQIVIRPNQALAVLVEGVTLGTAVTFDVYGYMARVAS